MGNGLSGEAGADVDATNADVEAALDPESCGDRADASAWRVAAASVVGTSHLERDAPCQDAHGVTIIESPAVGDVLVCVAADGAGSAPRGGDGARLLCEFLLRTVGGLLTAGGRIADLTKAQGVGWLDQFGLETDALAEQDGLSRRAYASTLLLAAVGQSEAAFYQVGDGATAISFGPTPDVYDVPFWPERGAYANTTYFATDPDVAAHLQVEHMDTRVDEVALFSDGVEGLALRYQDAAVHDPFFRGLFPPLRATAPIGALDEELSGALARFLGSERVNARTDDDKTLLLATRRPAPRS